MDNHQKWIWTVLIMSALCSSCAPAAEKVKPAALIFDPEPIRQLMLYDKDFVVPYNRDREDLERLIKQRDSISLPALGLTAFVFLWGGEVGGPWDRILCFCKDTGQYRQHQFTYTGEYAMTRMRGGRLPETGEQKALGMQLSQLVVELGPDIYLNRGKMEQLLLATMEELLGCPRIRQSLVDSLETGDLSAGYVGSFDFSTFHPTPKKCLDNIRYLVKSYKNPDPNVYFFEGELINGFWKATIRVVDHTGRYCIDLEYLNGECAYTLWL